MSNHSGIVHRNLEEAFALVDSAIPALQASAPLQPQWIAVSRFLSHVQYVAERLPNATYAMNLCENRYLFTVVFAAVIVKQQTNLLPQNRTLLTQAALIEEYQSCQIIHDGLDKLDNSVASLNVNTLNLPESDTDSIPKVALDHLAAIAFTSGSTGTPKPNLKYWRTFVDSTNINAGQMLTDTSQHANCLATVPGQHMWGLETSVLMPLMSKVCVFDKKPLFPQDIANHLSSLPEPRILVSTPVHLRAMVQSGVNFPKVDRILCATAPLSPALATEVEHTFEGELIEVFGCSEVGSMARRRTSTEQEWSLFPSLEIELRDDIFQLSAAHLPDIVQLQDRFEFSSSREFALCGRNEDMIEVAGKRGSLLELNKILLDCSGVKDGVVFLPEDGDAEKGITRPAAIAVVPEKKDRISLQEAFSKRLDAVFVPRPIFFVETLPREENGKLKRNKVLELFRTMLRTGKT